MAPPAIPNIPVRSPAHRRWLKATFVVALVSVAIVIALALVLRSETFWKRYIFPRYFGPYWYTALTWERFTPTVFPPGLRFENLELAAPGSIGQPFFTAEEVEFITTWGSDRRTLEVPRLILRNAVINYEVDASGVSNYERAVTRLYEGMPTQTAIPSATAPTLPAITLGRVEVRDISFRYVNLENRDSPIMVRYTVDGLLGINGSGVSDVVGSIDDFLILTGAGELTYRVDDLVYTGALDIGVTVTDLASWPNRTRAEARVALQGNGESTPLLRGTVAAPLNRLAVRPMATVIEDISLRLRTNGGNEPILSITGARFDPLRGEFDGQLTIDAKGPDLLAAISGFAAPQSRASLLERAKGISVYPLIAPESEALIRLSSRLRTSGVFQYAIVDERERLPMLLDVQTEGELLSVVPLQLLQRSAGLDPGPFAQVILSDTMSAFGALRLTIDEANNRGNVWSRLTIEPPDFGTKGTQLVLILSDRDASEAPVRFQLRPVRSLAGAPPIATLPSVISTDQGRLFPECEEVLGLVNAQLARTTGLLDAHRVENSQIRLEVQTESPRVLAEMLGPVFAGYQQARDIDLALVVERESATDPLHWDATFGIGGIEIQGVLTKTNLSGRLELNQSGNVVRARALSLDLMRTTLDDDPLTTYSLAMKPLIPGGPMPDTFLDLATGEGRLELQLDQLNREIVEVLLRLQTFGLSQRLAAPFYQRVLDVLGFRPDDPTARTEAEVLMRVRVGQSFEVASTLIARNVPAVGFFGIAETANPDLERFDAQFEQAVVLDRETGYLTPRRFRLGMFPSGGSEAFAEIVVLTDDSCQLSFPLLQALAEEEMIALVQGPPRSPMEAFRMGLRSYFDRAARLREALIAGEAILSVSVPRFAFSEFKGALESAGLPIEDGIFRMLLRCRVAAEEVGGERADGGFTLDGIRWKGSDVVMPQAEGKLLLERIGEEVHLRDMSTALVFDRDRAPTELAFSGLVSTSTIDSTWTLALRELNGAALHALSEVRTSAVGDSIALLTALPLTSIAEAAGARGNMGISMEGRSVSADRALYLNANQWGESLAVLPSLFRPLSFQMEQAVRVGDDGSLLLEVLRGHLDEEGNPASLAVLTLDAPVALATPGLADEPTTSVLSLRLEKDLDSEGVWFNGYRLPFVDRPIVGGRFKGEWQTFLSTGQLDRDERTIRSYSHFSAAVNELGLLGFPPRMAGMLTGSFSSIGPILELQQARLEATLDEEPMGEFTLEALYNGATERLSTSAKALRIRPLLIRAMPPEFAAWVNTAQAEGNFAFAWDGVVGTGRGDMRFDASARNLILPPASLPDGTVYTHPPIHVDLLAEGRVDRSTTSVLARQFELQLVSTEELLHTEPFERPSTWTTSLASVSFMGPFAYRWDDAAVLPGTAPGAGLAGTLGPVRLAEYRPLVTRYLGVPLIEGNLGGRWSLTTVGADATRRTSMSADLAIDDGKWLKRNGTQEAINGRVIGEGSVRRDIIRVDDLRVRLAYPEEGSDGFDELRLAGFVDLRQTSGRKQIDASLSSNGLRLDRVLDLYEDLQRETPSMAAPESEPSDPAIPRQAMATDPLEALRSFDGTLTIGINDLRFRQIEFNRLAGRARLESGTLVLQALNGFLGQGVIELSGQTSIPKEGPSPWNLGLIMRNVSVSPFISSFVDERYGELVSGRLNSTMDLQGAGFSTGDFRTMEGRGDVRLVSGRVQAPRLQLLFGEAAIEAESRFLVRGNRLLFTLTMPWNAYRDLSINGTLRNLVVIPGENPWIHFLARFTRMTTVGPGGRTEADEKGLIRPYRQPLFALLVEVDGPLDPARLPSYRLRNIEY